MAYSYHLVPHEQLACVTFVGTVTGPDVVRALASLYDDPAWRPSFCVLWDFRLVDQLLLRPQDFQALAAFDFGRLQGDGKDALVSTRPLDLAMGQMLQATAHDAPRQIGVFSTEAEARAWFGLPAQPYGLAA